MAVYGSVSYGTVSIVGTEAHKRRLARVPDMDNDGSNSRRAAVRHRALKEAKVVLSDWTAIDCILRNLSDTGARIEFGNPTNLPDEFRLLIVSSNMLLPAARVWQRGPVAGIRFTGPGRTMPPRKL